MLLNDILVENKMRMTDTFKKDLVSAFGHLTQDDQNYIILNIEKFVPKNTVVYFPERKGKTIPPFIRLENKLTVSQYSVKKYDISVDYVAAGPTDIIVGNDVSKLYAIIGDSAEAEAGINFEHPSNLFRIYDTLYGYFVKRELDPFQYPKAMEAVAGYYDTIATLNVNAIGLKDIYMMRTQVSMFAFMSELLKRNEIGNAENFTREFILLELNILTSLVPINQVVRYMPLMSRRMLQESTGKDVTDVVNDLIKILKSNELMNPFSANKFKTYIKPGKRNITFAPNNAKTSVNPDLLYLIRNTTREKIKDIIEDRTGVIEEKGNISFDIPEELITMYQVEFSREYPVALVPVPNDENFDSDGCNWRHIIEYDGELLVGFHLKDTTDKMYGIHIYHNAEDDIECTLAEFAGKKGASYQFIY